MIDLLFDSPEAAPATLLLAHGAGAAMDSKAMAGFASAFAGAGLRVARFEFGYMAGRRGASPGSSQLKRPPPKAETLIGEFVAAVESIEAAQGRHQTGRLIIGGKSMGGRVASMAADALHAEGRIAGLLCLGYPFHPPGKPGQLRTAHLERLKTPALIVQGTRDPFGTRAEVTGGAPTAEAAGGYPLSPAIEILWLADGDHDLKPRKAVSGFTATDHLRTLADKVAAWAASLPAPRTP